MIALAVIAVLASIYAIGVVRYDRRFPQRPFPRRSLAAETVAFVTLALALFALDDWADRSFAAHMAQHMLLVMIVAPALVLGAPVRLVLGNLPRESARRAARVLRSRAARALTSPAFAFVVFVVALWGSHVSALYEASLEHPLVHLGEHAVYLAAAALFWSQVFPVAPLPARLAPPARALYVFLTAPVTAFLGLMLISARTAMYAHYTTTANPWGWSPVEDQHAGGAVMWIAGSLGMLAAVLIVMAAWARTDRATTERREARAAALLCILVACAFAAPASAENMITSPRAGSAADGHGVYTLYCSSCHGTNLHGTVNAPSIRGVGRASVDWWVGTGRMPAAVPWEQATRKPPILAPEQIAAVVDYVASVAPGGPDVAELRAGRDAQRGRALFVQNCEHCHGAYGQGNAIGNSYQAPSLRYPTALQVAEAIRVGPGMMPKFGPEQFSQSELDDVVTYVASLRGDQPSPGGLQLSATGPFGEGAIAWLVVIVGITGYARLLGRKIAKEDAAVEPRIIE